MYPPSAIIPRLRQLLDRGGHPLESHFSFHGLVGFLPLPKLHLVLVTRKQKVGVIASRWVYGVSEWTLMPLQHKGKRGGGAGGAGEKGGSGAGQTAKYRELINGYIDLTKDFYFSYFYDLTHSLQHNLSTNTHLTAHSTPPSPPHNPAQPTPSAPITPLPQEEKTEADPPSPIVKSLSTPQFPSRSPPLPSAAGLSAADTVLFHGLNRSPSNPTRPLSPSPLTKSTSFSSNPWANLESSFAAAANAPPAAASTSPTSSPPGSAGPLSPSSASPSPSPSHAAAAAKPYLPPLPPRTHPYNDQYLWNFYLAHPLLTLLPHSSYWLIPLVHGFFAQQLLRHSHQDVLVTLLARRSRHYAGTRYIKRGVNAAGHVANEVESEQVVEVTDSRSTWFNTGASYASVLLLRGSIPLYWWQENVQSLKPHIVVAPSQDGYAATKAHVDDLIRRYGPHIDLLSLIKKEERHPQETRLGYAYTAAVAWLREAYKGEEGVTLDYQTYDFINMRSAKANVLRDVRRLVAPAVEAQGVFAHVTRVERDEVKEGAVVHSASDLMRRERRSIQRSAQRGVVRINCVDCLDRTNVAQFCVGKAAMRLQLQALGLVSAGSGEKVWPELLQVLQRFFTQHGDRIAQQYAGSGAMHRDALYDKEREEDEDAKDNSDLISGGVGQATRDRLTAEQADHPNPPTSPTPGDQPKKQRAGAGIAHNAISFAKRYVANNITDVEKQQAINVFLGHYIPAVDRRREVWDEDASTPLQEFDQSLGERGNDFFFVPYNPNVLLDVRPRKRRKGREGGGGGGGGAGEGGVGVEGGGGGEALRGRFGRFFDEKYNPTKLTSLEKELSKAYQRPVYVGGGLVVEQGVDKGSGQLVSLKGGAKEGTPVSRGSSGGSVEPSPIILSSSYSSTSLPPLPLLQDDADIDPPASPRSRTGGGSTASDLRSTLSPSLSYHTPPHSPSPASLSRHNSIDQPPTPSHQSAPSSPSHQLSPTALPSTPSPVDAFTFNLSQGVTSAPHPGHKNALTQANAVANKVGAATKSFFTKGLKTAFGVSSKGSGGGSGGGGGGGGGVGAGVGVNPPLHRVKSTGSVHGGGGGGGGAPVLVLPVAHLANSRSQDFHFLDAGNAVTLAHATTAAAGAGTSPLSPTHTQPGVPSPRRGLPPVHGNLPSSSSFTASTRSMSPVGSSVPRDMGPGLTRLDELAGGVTSLPSYILADSREHQQMLLADRILRQEQLALEAQTAPPPLSTTAASSAPSPDERYVSPRNDDEVFQHYLDTARLFRPVSIEIPWTETWQLQLAGSAVGGAGGLGLAGAGVGVGLGVGGGVGGRGGGGAVSKEVSVVKSVGEQWREEVAGEGSLVTSTIDGVEGASSAERNAELEERGMDPLGQSTEVPGDSDEAAVAKLAGEIET